jgi:hypothetical protein
MVNGKEDFDKIIDVWKKQNEADRNSGIVGILGPHLN